MMEEIKEKVKKIIYTVLATLPEEINDDSTLESLNADELDLINIILNVETEFKISLEDDEVVLSKNFIGFCNLINATILANTQPHTGNEGI